MIRSIKKYCRKGIGAVAIAAVALTGCRGDENANGGMPADFNSLTNNQKMSEVMKRMPADSAARFICDAALDKIPGVRVDSLAMMTLYAYENYHGENVDKFQNGLDSYIAELPLDEKWIIKQKIGTEDATQTAYSLGLEYTSQIRDNHKTVAEVEQEIKKFRKACGSDTATYNRFITAFRIALENDHGVDLPEDIYRKFINYR